MFIFVGFLIGSMILPTSAVYYANFIIMFLMLGLVVLALISNKKEAGYYLGFGKTLLAALLVLSIVNIFIGGKIFNIVVSIIGVVIFSVDVMYDISFIKLKSMAKT